MITAIVLAVAAFFAGQQLAPVEVRNVPVPVYVSVPVECREEVPARPVMPTEEFTEKPALDQYVRAARAEIERREGYEIQLRGALERCTAPIKSE
jgi:hypothetical protein